MQSCPRLGAGIFPLSIKRAVSAGNAHITTGFIGVQPARYPIDTICRWTGGPHEAVLTAALEPQARRAV